MTRTLSAIAAILAASALTVSAQMTHVSLKDAKGQDVGMVMLSPAAGGGVTVAYDFKGLPAGEHALHIHQVAKCEAPFTSAGPHFNPTQHAHGFEAANGYHAGDLPNVVIPASGEGAAESFAEGVTLRPGSASLLDADGAALIVHANADDHHTDPAGNAGDRIACGVVRQ